MPNTTPNLGFNTFLETDVFDYQAINTNFDIIDALLMPSEVGTMDSTYSYSDYDGTARTGTATWNYKKYSDKTIELNTTFTISLLGTSNGSSAPYYSNLVTLPLPTTINSVYKVGVDSVTDSEASISSAQVRGWTCMYATSLTDIKNNGVRFRVLADKKRQGGTTMIFFIEVKGVTP